MARRSSREQYFVTMSTLRELLDNQKREFTSLLETTNRRIDTLARKVQAVRGSLQYSHREIGGVKSLSQELEQRVNGIESQITRLRSDINVDLTRDDHSDNQSLSSFSVQSYNPSYTSYQEDYQSDYQDDIDNQSDNQSDYQSDNQSDNQSGYQSDNQSDQSRDDSDAEEESDIWQLPVKGQDGSTIFIRIHKDATVDEVISQISKRKGIPIERLRVLYTTRQLEYGQNKHLSDYGIQDMFTLHYIVRIGGPCQICSRPQEDQMEDEEMTDDSGTEESSNIWQLYAKLNDRITHCIKIHKDAPVDTLIKMISERNKIPIESQSIVYTTKRLEYGQGKHLSDYGITDKSTMFVVLFVRGASSGSHNSSTPQGEQEEEDDKATGASDTEEGRYYKLYWQLSVNDEKGRTYNIMIRKNGKVDRLIDKISQTNGARPEEMRFIFMTDHQNRILEYGKGKRLSDYGIQDKSTIQLYFSARGSPGPRYRSTPCGMPKEEDSEAASGSDVDSNILQLSVLQLSGRKDYITIHKDATVDELMEKISEKTSISTVQIRHVMHKGQRLYQGRRLSDYSVQNKSALFLTLRLGASPHPSPT